MYFENLALIYRFPMSSYFRWTFIAYVCQSTCPDARANLMKGCVSTADLDSAPRDFVGQRWSTSPRAYLSLHILVYVS